MTHKTLNTTLAAAALMATGLATAHAVDTDNQVRLGFSGRKDIANGVRLDVATEQRFFNDVSNYYYSEFDLGFNIKVNDWLSIAPTLRFKEERSLAMVDGKKLDNTSERYYRNEGQGVLGRWTRETRPMLNATLQHTFDSKWKLENRNRFEWRQYASDTSDWKRFRNRTKVTSPWKLGGDLKINPYATVELFQPLSGRTGGKPRTARQDYEAALGVSAEIAKDLSLDLYYMAEFREQSNNSLRHTANILGLAAQYKF